ncbi:MAG: PilZ domain-containing protein [Gammaproteobacteria bacterium]|nr:PilZ domain-containing protein [Gammaproteobacteria bacterium]MDH5730381.1 PilZ domain-containing protein [Gammaproteobacteria bacterium]
MRKYIRHPSDIPLVCEPDEGQASQDTLSNISLGGLSFKTSHSISLGSRIVVKIPLIEPNFSAHGKVVWCESIENGFDIGVELSDQNEAFQARMIEQICHIEHYKREIEEKEGRVLSGEEAAREWIRRHAADFPQIDQLEHSD